MTTKQTEEKGMQTFVRFGFSGVVFTILGPCLFWLAYPLGPFLAVIITELSVHIVRFIVFRALVFPARKGYNVSLPGYVLSALPVSATGIITVAFLRNHLDRISLTLATASIGIVIGFAWSRHVYAYKGWGKREN